MNFYFKICILALFLGLSTVILIHGMGIGSEGSSICSTTPADKYDYAIKQYGYGCNVLGFPIPDLENDVWGHNPHFYPLKSLLNLLILFSVFFGLLTLVRNYLKRFFDTVSTINRATRSAIFLELLPGLLIFLIFLGGLPIREGVEGVENIFDIYLYSWWPSFNHWTFLFFPIPVITLLGIIFGIIGLVRERHATQSGVSVVMEDLKTKVLRKTVLYLPLLLAIGWIIITVTFIGALSGAY